VSHSDALVAHQFEDLEQQRKATTLGMWLFLVTEVMFFGGLFAAYLVYRTAFAEAFHVASRDLNLTLGTINTVVLLTSGFTMTLAVHAAQTGKSAALSRQLAITILLGCAFLAIKGIEYYHKYETHHVPGPAFVYEGANPAHAQIFFVLYFVMTGVHAAHMLVGIGLLAGLLVLALRGRFTPAQHAPVVMCGLYWSFVDIIWVFLFPLLYLIDRTSHV